MKETQAQTGHNGHPTTRIRPAYHTVSSLFPHIQHRIPRYIFESPPRVPATDHEVPDRRGKPGKASPPFHIFSIIAMPNPSRYSLHSNHDAVYNLPPAHCQKRIPSCHTFFGLA